MEDIEKAGKLLGSSLFLFGAGATWDAGCKVSSQMLEAIMNMDFSKAEKGAIDFLLASLHYHASWKNQKEIQTSYSEYNRHKPNIEDLVMLIRRIVHRDSYLPYPITGSWADKINFLEIEWQSQRNKDTSPEEVLTLFENLEQRLTRELYGWLSLGSEDTSYLEPVNEFLKSTPADSPTLEFFSLNYDLVFEKHFNRNDETLLDTGFSQGFFVGFDKKEKGNKRINYYKLHGSLNWTREDTGRIKEYTPAEFNQTLYGNPHIIFGHGGKLLSVDPFISLLYHFKEKLEQSELIFVIGYSFFDPYINNLILEGLSKETVHSKKMVVVNPQFAENKMLDKEESDKLSPQEKDSLIKNRFVDYVQRVQLSAYLSDMPKFNLTEVSPELIKIIPTGAKEFLNSFFSRKGTGLAGLYDELQTDATSLFD